MKHTRWISLLLALILLVTTVLASCTAATAPSREDGTVTHTAQTLAAEPLAALTVS